MNKIELKSRLLLPLANLRPFTMREIDFMIVKLYGTQTGDTGIYRLGENHFDDRVQDGRVQKFTSSVDSALSLSDILTPKNQKECLLYAISLRENMFTDELFSESIPRLICFAVLEMVRIQNGDQE